MRSWRALSETIHLTALGLWLGSLVMTGAAAAIIFPTVKALRPSLPEFSGYTGDHWRIAGGQIASRVFLVCDVVQFICAILAGVSVCVLLIVARVSVRRPAVLARLATLGIAIAVLGGQLFFLAPRMNGHMLSFWAAAQRGDNAAAAVSQAAFDKLHPVATNLLGVATLAVLVAMVLGAWAASTPERNDAWTGLPRIPTQTHRPAKLEEPLLLRTQR
jgi:hypothetical protein